MSPALDAQGHRPVRAPLHATDCETDCRNRRTVLVIIKLLAAFSCFHPEVIFLMGHLSELCKNVYFFVSILNQLHLG